MLPENFAFAELYGHRTVTMTAILDQYIANVNKFLYVIPEYNGSFPGVLKTFIDAVPPRMFREKKAAMVGLSDGRSGNVRGQEHLTGILHYLKMFVHYSKPKLSGIDELMDAEHHLNDPKTLDLMRAHAQMLIEF
jgi:NAD(P)H-dependent FMN reductase